MADIELSPEMIAKLKEILATKTIRDVRTSNKHTLANSLSTPIDTRLYFYIRMSQFECVVDSRDHATCSSKDELFRHVLDDKNQAWYFAGYRADNDLSTRIEEWTHTQYITWLRR